MTQAHSHVQRRGKRSVREGIAYVLKSSQRTEKKVNKRRVYIYIYIYIVHVYEVQRTETKVSKGRNQGSCRITPGLRKGCDDTGAQLRTQNRKKGVSTR